MIFPETARFLIIRRDNIGDLVCTTPLIRALRERFPKAYIAVLANSYNAPVLDHHDDIDKVYAYTKAKHRGPDESLLGIYWQRLKMFRALRAERFDFAIIASTRFLVKPLTLARVSAPSHIVGFVEGSHSATRHIDVPVPYVKAGNKHLVEELAELVKPFGISGPLPPMRVFPDPALVARMAANIALPTDASRRLPVYGIHISARKVPQRWPAAHFIELMRRIQADHPCRFLLFWSPGSESNPTHPGDDEKAQGIIQASAGLPIDAFPTARLSELVAGLSLCDVLICSDGGAMHVAAALGKPIVCFFGNSDASVWYPWGVPHRLLQKPSQNVADISAAEAWSALSDLLREVR